MRIGGGNVFMKLGSMILLEKTAGDSDVSV